jgi:hypothetical protein
LFEERQEFFVAKDADGRTICYVRFEDVAQPQMSMKRLAHREAFLLAMNIAESPMVPRHILKETPRQHYSASRDD